MRSDAMYTILFGAKKEHTTPVSDVNRIMAETSANLINKHPSRHYDGRFCPCSGCRRFQDAKAMAAHRHTQEIENSKRNRGESTQDSYSYIRA